MNKKRFYSKYDKEFVYEKVYTKKEVAFDIINSMPDLNQYDLIIDPFAGSGSFSNQIKDAIAYDISPDNENIIQKDFFNFEKFNKKTLIIT